MNDRIKRIREYKTELIFQDANGKEEVKEMCFRTPSMSAQDAYIAIRQEHQQKINEITNDEKYKDFKGLPSVDPAGYVGNPQMLASSMEMSGKLIKCHAKHTIMYYKSSVDTRQLTTAQQDDFNQDPDGEFWMNQNLVMMEDAVDFFRGHLKV